MIEMSAVTSDYRGPDFPILEDLSLNVSRGEFVFLVGPSGSGKTSILRLVTREQKATSGTVRVLGSDVAKLSSREASVLRRRMGIIFQDFRLFSNRTVYQNVAFAAQAIGRSEAYVQSAVNDVIDRVGLESIAFDKPASLSGGQQQRAAIARALVNRPDILLADEPTGNLDPASSGEIMQLLERINLSGTTVVMATHDTGIVDKMMKRVIEIRNGKIFRDTPRSGYLDGLRGLRTKVNSDGATLEP